MKPVMSVAYSDLYKPPEWRDEIYTMQPRSLMWLIGGEPPWKSGALASYDLCPKSWIVLRLMQYEPGFSADQLSDPYGMASRWRDCVSAVMPYIGDPGRTIVCGPLNEFHPDRTNPHRFKLFADMEAQAAFLIKETMGLRYMFGNFSVGTPDIDMLPIYRMALMSGHQHGGVLGLHQYFQLYASDEALWTSERDQHWEEILSDPSCSMPIMITETGEEQVWKPEDPQQARILRRLTGGIKTPGWKTTEAAWRFRGETLSKEELFVRELRKLAHNYSKRIRIKSSFVFMRTREPGWQDYDPGPVMPQLIEWIGDEELTGLTSLDPDKWIDEPAPVPIPVPDPLGTYRVTARGLNVRKSPTADVDTNKVHVLKAGDLIDVQDLQGSWARISTPFETWVHRDYIVKESES